MSTVNGKKSDGSSITFNFKLENGLPFKPIINPSHKYMKEANTGKKALVINLTHEEFSLLDFTNKPTMHSFFETKEVFLEMDKYYLVFENVPQLFLQNIEQSNISCSFFKEDNVFIISYAM